MLSFRSSLVGVTASFAAASVLFVPALAEADATTPVPASPTTAAIRPGPVTCAT